MMQKSKKIKLSVLLAIVVFALIASIYMSQPREFAHEHNDGYMGGRGKCIGFVYPILSKTERGTACLGKAYDTMQWII